MLSRYVAIPVFAVLGAFPLLRQQPPAKPAAFSIPPDIAAKSNPVRSTAAGLLQARRMYGYDCAMCHGKEGAGNGDMASSLKTRMRDYRDPASLKDMTDGDLFYIIQKGKGEMPGESDRENAEQLWMMVRVVRSFGKK